MVKVCPWCEKINPFVKTNCKFCNIPLHLGDCSKFYALEYFGDYFCLSCEETGLEDCICFPCKNSKCDCTGIYECLDCKVCNESCLHYNSRDNYIYYDEEIHKWIAVDFSQW